MLLVSLERRPPFARLMWMTRITIKYHLQVISLCPVPVVWYVWLLHMLNLLWGFCSYETGRTS
jgi:hypothetical protein